MYRCIFILVLVNHAFLYAEEKASGNVSSEVLETEKLIKDQDLIIEKATKERLNNKTKLTEKEGEQDDLINQVKDKFKKFSDGVSKTNQKNQEEADSFNEARRIVKGLNEKQKQRIEEMKKKDEEDNKDYEKRIKEKEGKIDNLKAFIKIMDRTIEDLEYGNAKTAVAREGSKKRYEEEVKKTKTLTDKRLNLGKALIAKQEKRKARFVKIEEEEEYLEKKAMERMRMLAQRMPVVARQLEEMVKSEEKINKLLEKQIVEVTKIEKLKDMDQKQQNRLVIAQLGAIQNEVNRANQSIRVDERLRILEQSANMRRNKRDDNLFSNLRVINQIYLDKKKKKEREAGKIMTHLKEERLRYENTIDNKNEHINILRQQLEIEKRKNGSSITESNWVIDDLEIDRRAANSKLSHETSAEDYINQRFSRKPLINNDIEEEENY